MQGGGLNGAFSEGTQHPRAGGSVLLPRTAQRDLTKPLSFLCTLILWVCQAVKPLQEATPQQKSGGRGDWGGGRVRKTLQKFRDLVKTDQVSEEEYEQTRNTIKNHASGRKAIKAY